MDSANEDDSSDLRIVLLGVCGAGKSSVGNAILGREAFNESRTRESEIQIGRTEDRNISIIDTPGFFNTHLTDEELKKQMMKSLDLCSPGPHVFLLIVNLENFRDDQRNIIQKILEYFGPQALKFTLALFTGREKMSKKEWMLFMLSPEFQELVSHFRGQYHAINSRNKVNQTQITDLLQKIDEFIKQNDDQHYNSEICSMSWKSMRIKKEQVGGKEIERKEPEMRQKESLTTGRVLEDRRDCVIVKVKERQKNKQEEKTQNQEKEAKQEGEQVKSESFDIKMGGRATYIVTEEIKQSDIPYVTQTKKTTDIYEGSLDRFLKFSGEGLENAGKTQGKPWGIIQESWSYKKTCWTILKEEVRIVMVGKTGVGKSATGNTIVGEDVFKEDFSTESVTKNCQKHQKVIDYRAISIIDTPGLFDTSISKQHLKEEIVKCIEMSVPGPHVFLLVLRLDMRLSDEEKKTVKWIQENFGKDATRYTIVLFTRGDQLKTSIEEFLAKNKQIRELVSQCKGGYHVFNNEDGNEAQVTELLKKVESMVNSNGGEHYTSDMFEKAQKRLQMKKVEDAALMGASVAGVGAAVAGGAALVATTGGVALPVGLLVGAAVLTGGPGTKVLADKIKHSLKRNSTKEK